MINLTNETLTQAITQTNTIATETYFLIPNRKLDCLIFILFLWGCIFFLWMGIHYLKKAGLIKFEEEQNGTKSKSKNTTSKDV